MSSLNMTSRMLEEMVSSTEDEKNEALAIRYHEDIFQNGKLEVLPPCIFTRV
jgi:hypothetical protein